MKLNLKIRPTIHVKKKRSTMFVVISLAMALFSVTAIALVLYFHLSINTDLKRIQGEVTRIEDKLKQELSTVKEVDSFVKQYETLTTDVMTINRILRNRAFPWIDILNRIEENIDACTLHNLTITRRSDSVTGKLTGVGEKIGDISSFIQRMHAVNSYLSLKVDSYRTVGRNGAEIAFNLGLSAVSDWYEQRAKTVKGHDHGK